jgi:membrane associated rhomboid family serine protease
MISERQYKPKISLGESRNALMMLIAVCLVVFVIMAFLKALWYFNYSREMALPLYRKNVLGWFILPADMNAWLSKPWTLLTHMFVHDSIWAVFANMLWLWSFGFIMQDLTGNRKIIPVFLYGAVAGALAFMLAYNLIPSLRPQLPVASSLGASAGVMAVAVATTVASPGYRIFPMIQGGIPLWVLTVIYIAIDLVALSANDTGHLLSDMAGALTGFLFIFFLRRGYDGSEWMNNFFDWFGNLFNPDKPKKGKNIREEMFYKAPATPYKKTPHVTQERIDAILDKINQKGYSFLTEEEKDLLKRAAREEM